MQEYSDWILLKFLNNGVSSEYQKLINSIEKMTEDEWDKFNFYAVDKEILQKFREKGVPHYSKFINRSLAVKFPSGHIM